MVNPAGNTLGQPDIETARFLRSSAMTNLSTTLQANPVQVVPTPSLMKQILSCVLALRLMIYELHGLEQVAEIC